PTIEAVAMTRFRALTAAFAALAFVPALAADEPRTDRFGDPLPPGAVARLGTVRWRAGHNVVAAVYRPDGKTLLTVSQDYVVSVWEVATGRELRRFDVGGGKLVADPYGRILTVLNSLNGNLS